MATSAISHPSWLGPMFSDPSSTARVRPENGLLDRILEPGALSTVFQPIVDLRTPTPVLVAVECLTRGPQRSSLEAPDVLFDFARRKRAEVVVDRAAIATALASAAPLPEALPLQINLHASTLSCDDSLPAFIEKLAAAHGFPLSRLTVEVIEHAELIDEALMVASLETLRSRGVGIALDDIGHGHSNFRMMLLTRPGLLKVDRYLVSGVAQDPLRQTVIAKLHELALSLPALIVAEGIETLEDLEFLRSIGVEEGQGYLFAKPMSAVDLADSPLLSDFARRAGSCRPRPSTT